MDSIQRDKAELEKKALAELARSGYKEAPKKSNVEITVGCSDDKTRWMMTIQNDNPLTEDEALFAIYGMAAQRLNENLKIARAKTKGLIL